MTTFYLDVAIRTNSINKYFILNSHFYDQVCIYGWVVQFSLSTKVCNQIWFLNNIFSCHLKCSSFWFHWRCWWLTWSGKMVSLTAISRFSSLKSSNSRNWLAWAFHNLLLDFPLPYSWLSSEFSNFLFLLSLSFFIISLSPSIIIAFWTTVV